MRSVAFLAVLVALAEAYFAIDVLLPLMISMFCAVMLEPIVAALERRRIPRVAGATVAVALFLIAIAGAGWALYQPFSRVVEELPRYSDKLRSGVREFQRKTEKIQQSANPETLLKPTERREAPPQGGGGQEQALSAGRVALKALASFFHGVGIAVFVPFLIAFALTEKETLLSAFEGAAAGECDVGYVLTEVPRMVRAYFLGSFVVGLVLAVLQWVVFQSLGLENAVGLGILTGFLNMIPVLGLPAAVLLPVAQGLLQFHSFGPFAAIILSLGSLHVIAGGLIVPRFVGAHVRIGGGAATAAMLFWGWYWGIVGFLLAIPLTALARIALESREQTRALAAFLLDKPRR